MNYNSRCSSIVAVLLVLLGGAVCAWPDAAHARPRPVAGQITVAPTRLDGVWRNIARRFWQTGSPPPALSAIPKAEQTQIKFITAGHFIWYIYDPANNNIVESLTGTCTLSGDAYQETPQHYMGNSGFSAALGQPQRFTVKLEGDRMHLAGTLKYGGDHPGSGQIEEVWVRVK